MITQSFPQPAKAPEKGCQCHDPQQLEKDAEVQSCEKI